MVCVTEQELRAALRKAQRIPFTNKAEGRKLSDFWEDIERDYGTLVKRALCLEDRFYLRPGRCVPPVAVRPLPRAGG